MIIDQSKIFFIHIPRTAGTSVEEYLNPGSELYGRHLNYSEFKERRRKDYKKFFVFTIVRNPWDRINSCYNWLKQKGAIQDMSMKDYLFYIDSYHKNPGAYKKDLFIEKHSWWVDESYQDINMTLKYENIAKEIEILRSVSKIKTGIGQFPYKNKTSIKTNYTESYDKEGAEIIRSVYSEEIERFGYNLIL